MDNISHVLKVLVMCSSLLCIHIVLHGGGMLAGLIAHQAQGEHLGESVLTGRAG